MQFYTEDLFKTFNNSNCPVLHGKPKFFIIQSCRGDEIDEGIETGSEGGSESSRFSRDASPFEVREDRSWDPTWSDIIILYSCIPGHVSYRFEKRGSLLGQSIDYAFRKFGTLELKEILDKISLTVAKFETPKGLKQVAAYESRGFFHKLYFPQAAKLNESTFDQISNSGSPNSANQRNRNAIVRNENWKQRVKSFWPCHLL